MDLALTRGAVAALTFGAFIAGASAARAQAGGGGVVRVVPRGDTTVLLRVQGVNNQAKLESLTVIIRALEGEPSMSETAVRLRGEVETMVRAMTAARAPGSAAFVFRGDDKFRQAFEAHRLKGWIGANVGLVPREEFFDSTGHFVHYFRYPSILSVEPDSPALRAGLAPGDVLLAYDGQDVVRERVNLGEMLVPDRRLAVTVRRDGEVKEYSMVVAKTPERIAERRWIEIVPAMAPQGRGGYERAIVMGEARRAPPPGAVSLAMPGMAPGPRVLSYGNVVMVGRNSVFGANLVTVDSIFARATNLEVGVIVQGCAQETPAYKAGLRVGDVITSVAGQPVSTASDVQGVVLQRASERVVTIQLLREKKPMAVTVKW